MLQVRDFWENVTLCVTESVQWENRLLFRLRPTGSKRSGTSPGEPQVAGVALGLALRVYASAPQKPQQQIRLNQEQTGS